MLRRCPEFYTQVLHLMNKLCLPCPFDDSEYEEAQQSEQDEEESNAELINPTATGKACRSAVEVAARYARRLKLQLGQKRRFPNEPVRASHPKLPKKPLESAIRVNLKGQLPIGSLEIAEVNRESFGSFGPQRQVIANEVPAPSNFDFLNLMSIEEIRRRCISRSEWKKWPAFNRYTPGEPSSRLYVKNLSKKVTELDLKRIYGNFVNATFEEARDAFDVRLMQCGRLRGQAFISLGSIEQARTAIRLTNGLMVHDKPLVVAFARSCRSSEAVS
uniref:RNA-binding region-containing protein 3 n=1 Tax=Trichuris muris TaxID=70415 RepID=A0A5S6QUT0_TRIMR